jgi:hypothetical protein
MASGIVRAQACGAEMGKVPVKCRACKRACPNGCEVEGRKKRGSGQSHNDKKGDRGDRHETKRSRHLPAGRHAPEEVLQNEENEEQQQPAAAAAAAAAAAENEEELEESSLLTTAEKNCAQLGNPKGRSRTYAELCAFLFVTYMIFRLHANGTLMALAMRHVGVDFTMYAVFARKLFGMGDNTARAIFRNYEADGSVLVNENKRGRGSPNYMLDCARKLQPAHLAQIETFIAMCHGKKGGGRVTINSISDDLLRKFRATDARTRTQSDLVLVTVKRSVVRYALVHMLHYRWGKIRLKKINGDVERSDVIRTYLKAYADALALERRGTHIIVYTDEVINYISPPPPWTERS